MSDERRLKRLEKIALRRASEIVMHELSDPRMTFITLTRVELAKDLAHAVIYWSTLEEGGQRSKVEHALRDAAPFVQVEIAKVFATRRTPHVRFEFDPSIAGAVRVSGILDRIEKERREREGAGAGPAAGEPPGGEDE
jgi:ribosome-binding factor A